MRKLKESSSSQFQKDINFSDRELDVIACITNGRTAKKAISELLGISDRTASTHTYNITKKLNCSSCGGILSHVEKYGLRNTLRLRYNHLLISYQYKKALNKLKYAWLIILFWMYAA